MMPPTTSRERFIHSASTITLSLASFAAASATLSVADQALYREKKLGGNVVAS